MAVKGVVTRAQWKARPPDGGRNAWVPPMKGLTVHWEGTGAPPARFHISCAGIVRTIQNFHMNTRGWSDIAYNWLVCNHGYVFVGRGWDAASGANGDNDANAHYPAVSWMGIVGTHPTDAALSAMATVRSWVYNRGGHEIHPHHDWISTMCPGPDLTAWVAKNGPDPLKKDPPPPPPPPKPAFTVTYTDDLGTPHTRDLHLADFQDFFRNVANNHTGPPDPYPVIVSHYLDGAP